jgi:hypothetical protein
MIVRKFPVVAAFGAIAGVGVAAQVWAGADKVAFPENYATGVHYLTVDKPSKQVHEFYAAPASIEAARKGEPMPDRTILVDVQYNAKLDADGNPVKGPMGASSKPICAAVTSWKSARGGVRIILRISATASGNTAHLSRTRPRTKRSTSAYASVVTSR